MSSNTLSAVLEKQIQRLCLTDFPCGNGQWRTMESTDALLDLLNYPQSPWWKDESWSAQTSALRQLAVLAPERLNPDFICSYFTSLHIVDKGVSSIDVGLLKFSKLEELVLSSNDISEIHTENLPRTLKNLDLRANRLFSLNNRSPHDLQYLVLGSNSLGSSEDISHLTGKHWPQLVSLDLGDCEFHEQRTLLNALSTLPCLKTLVLEGNPFTLSPSYPGLTVDRLPQLFCLDASWITTEKRNNFRGMAEMKGLIIDLASATVSVGRIRGIPDPMAGDEMAYFITYEFLSHQKPVNLAPDSEVKSDALTTEDSSSDADLQPQTEALIEVNAEETFSDIAHVSKHSTSKVTWSQCMDVSDTQTHVVSSLRCFKKFLSQGLFLWLEEEQVVPGPVASEDASGAKPSRTAKEKKGGKGNETTAKSATTKDKTKDKSNKSVPTLVPDAPIRRILGCVHVPLQSLVRGGQKVDIVCDFGVLHTDSEDLGKQIKEDKKEEESKQTKGNGRGQKNAAASSKGKGKGRKEPEGDVQADKSLSVQLEPVTVELSVRLEKWQSASEVRQLQLPHQT